MHVTEGLKPAEWVQGVPEKSFWSGLNLIT
jgi:hypothetical protein